MGERWLSKQRYVFLARQKKKTSVCVTVTVLTDDASRFAKKWKSFIDVFWV